MAAPDDFRVYSYVVRYDIGFAPNPFHGWCTLATCKPGIRGTASAGDWIVGTGSKQRSLDGSLVYAMQVEERLTFDEYWEDDRFQSKKPDVRGSLKVRYGDNIYHRNPQGEWVQLNSRHSHDDGMPNLDHIARDASQDSVLLSTRFTYWGAAGPPIPDRFRDWDGVDICVTGPGYQWRTLPQAMREAVVDWIDELPAGVQADPADW